MPPLTLTVMIHYRQLWDKELVSEKVIQDLTENMQVYQYVTQTSVLHPLRDHTVLRYDRYTGVNS